MIELPDDELDKLFKKSAEELDPQFDPEDWNTLRKRLDAHDGKTAGGWLRKWWPMGLLALLIPAGFAIYFLTKNAEPKVAKTPVSELARAARVENERVENGSVETSSGKTGNAGNDNVETGSGKTGNAGKSNIVSGNVKKDNAENGILESENVENGHVENGEVEKANRESRKIVSKKTKSERLKIDRSNDEKSVAITTKGVAGQEIKLDKPIRNKEEGISKSSSKSSITDYQISKTLPRSQSKTGGVYLEPKRSKQEGGDGALLIPAEMLASRKLNWNNEPEIPAVTFTMPEVAQEPAAAEKSVEDYAKWAVRLGYSPDLSSVGFKNFTKPGAAFSLLIEYGLTSRLYLQGGVVRSVKDYSANAGEYKLPAYVTDINTPYDVDGSCTMIEIPLGFRFNVAQNAQSKWFIGTGVSSYYAQKEKYKYHYAKYVHLQKDGWKGKTGWFLLSHINASVGYERSITKKLSLVAEPYIRIPVKGVGYGKVNLMTIGTWISLRYTPAFK
jgi:hypothetical protein